MRAAIGWTFLLLITLVLTLEAAAQGWTSHPHTDGDLQLLLPLAESVIVSDQKVTMKHTSAYHPYHDESDFRQTAQLISTTFKLTAPVDPIQKQDLLLYRFTLNDTDTTQATLLLIGFPDGRTQLSLTAETVQASGISRLQNLQQQWTTQLQSLGLQSNWNVMIQGNVGKDTNESTTFQQLGITPFLQLRLTESLHAQELARYEDTNSLSISYHSANFDEPADENTKKMNLQLAVHRDSINGQQRITIATPAISIAY
ncbi:TATA-box binding [Paenibacillus sp. 1_12]|uniref:YwmB family TATA-box binding protein n=1 Tax=Paenibacillus sp. 1_12 TaxID=1566278 RepID=UPI0008E8DD2D|nr:YwmB family TATA-box binding protein [Paenibacillus sp. 1_12]SFM01809.1 TATA-box binding [Paenibacillus sp. 1_12]